MSRTGIIVQARMGSSRLPGKMLMMLSGGSVLEAVIARLSKTRGVDDIVIATSDKAEDTAIAAEAERLGVASFRGSEQDVLGRFRAAAAARNLDTVIRVCGDAPLTDPTGIEALLAACRDKPNCGLIHNRHKRGWPIGAAADLIRRDALESAADEAEQQDEREHVTPFLLRHAERFGVCEVAGPSDLLEQPYYMAIDYPDDLVWFRDLYEAHGNDPAGPAMSAVCEWIRKSGREPRMHDWAA